MGYNGTVVIHFKNLLFKSDKHNLLMAFEMLPR